jgi:hypothetical protein
MRPGADASGHNTVDGCSGSPRCWTASSPSASASAESPSTTRSLLGQELCAGSSSPRWRLAHRPSRPLMPAQLHLQSQSLPGIGDDRQTEVALGPSRTLLEQMPYLKSLDNHFRIDPAGGTSARSAVVDHGGRLGASCRESWCGSDKEARESHTSREAAEHEIMVVGRRGTVHHDASATRGTSITTETGWLANGGDGPAKARRPVCRSSV